MNESRFGYLALIGSPNAGKSTLLNSCLGVKIAGVSTKPQTTRNRIVGLVQRGVSQIALLDTPGIHGQGTKSRQASATRKLSRYMNREAWGAAREADHICYLIDICKGATPEDIAVVKNLAESHPNKLTIILSKIDKLQKNERTLAEIEARNVISAEVGTELPFLLLSAKQKQCVEDFSDYVARIMPVGEHLYPADTLTDRSVQFVCSELIREQLFRQLGQELPYSTAVQVDSLEKGAKVMHIMATVFVPKAAHKGIVIGRGGQKLKEIGSEARASIERYLNEKIFLELFVKVQENWVERDNLISELLGPSYEDVEFDDADELEELELNELGFEPETSEEIVHQ